MISYHSKGRFTTKLTDGKSPGWVEFTTTDSSGEERIWSCPEAALLDFINLKLNMVRKLWRLNIDE